MLTLKRQLIALALLTLLLPWLAWWHFAALDQRLRQLYSDALAEQAHIAGRFMAAQPAVGQMLAARNQRALALWLAKPMPRCLMVIWRSGVSLALATTRLAMVGELMLAISGGGLHLAFHLPGQPHWYSPQAVSFDYQRLSLVSAGRYRLQPSAAGRAAVAKGRDDGADYDSQALWQAAPEASQVEWYWLRSFHQQAITVTYHSAVLGYGGFLNANNQSQYLASPQAAQLSALTPVLDGQQKVWLFDRQGLLVDATGQLDFGGLLLPWRAHNLGGCAHIMDCWRPWPSAIKRPGL